MEIKQQWCARPECPNFGRVDAGNIKVHRYVERRLYCVACRHTFSADQGTFFATLRSERTVVLDVLKLLGERNSLRAIERLEHCPHNTSLHWLALAGQHTTAVSQEVIHGLRLTQAQVDELWTFVKKNKRIADRRIRRTWATRGFGEPSPCPVGCAS